MCRTASFARPSRGEIDAQGDTLTHFAGVLRDLLWIKQFTGDGAPGRALGSDGVFTPEVRAIFGAWSGSMQCFFNLAGAIYDPDVKGYEVATIDQARILAAQHIAEVIRDRPGVVWAGEEVRMEVTDERQFVLFTIIVAGVDAAAVAGQPSSFRPKR